MTQPTIVVMKQGSYSHADRNREVRVVLSSVAQESAAGGFYVELASLTEKGAFVALQGQFPTVGEAVKHAETQLAALKWQS